LLNDSIQIGFMKKVYIIEDDEQVNKMYERAFRFAGYDVAIAFNGEEALEKLRQDTDLPTVIIMDVMMPKMSGIDLLHHIKQDQRLKDVPTVVLTNSFLKENADQFLNLGANMYLVKMENTSTQIIEKVEKLVENYSVNKNNKV
jgi:CheY-like chemotaxis protein